MDETSIIDRARGGDDTAFERLVAPYRSELHAHCYRMLGSYHDADDALQDALLGAWRGIERFEGRSSVRAWLYTIATHAAMRVAKRRPQRVLSIDHGPATIDPQRLGDPVDEPIWLEPYPDAGLGAAPLDPAACYDAQESVEIAFIAALQHLPATQRAVLILREVLGFTAAEVAGILETTVAAVNSALQRARTGLDRRLNGRPTQREVRGSLGDAHLRRLLDALTDAWDRADVAAITDLLAADARMSMPPLPAWFDGRDAIGRFMRERMFDTPWRVTASSVNGQPALACYQQAVAGEPYTLGGLVALSFADGRVDGLISFLRPMIDERFGLPSTFPEKFGEQR